MVEELPKGVMNKLKKLEELDKKYGKISSDDKIFNEQQNLRISAMKEIGIRTKEALNKFLGTNKNLDPRVKSALRLLFPNTIKRKNNFNKGGLIDYRKTGMFK
tara:strand:- start:303 stop:611 length:309 start_codon:yes stop_codon:yes gene_type:complete